MRPVEAYDDVFIICLVYFALFLGVKVVNIISVVIATPLYMIVCTGKQGPIKHDGKILPLVIETIINIIVNTFTIVLDFAMLLVQKLLVLLPFIFLVIFLSFISSNSDSVLKGVIDFYDGFLIKSDYFQYIRKGSWIFKIVFELVSPCYNWVIDTVAGGIMEIVSLLVDDEANRKNLISMVSEFGNLFITVGVAVSKWMTVNFKECQYDRVVADMRAMDTNMFSTLSHRCFDNDFRDIELIASTTTLKTVFTSFHTLASSLCPTAASFIGLIFYPIYDEHINVIAHNMINIVLSGGYTTWDITQLRCRCAHQLELSTALCVPDLFPLFRYALRAVESMGALVDNWVNIAHLLVLSFFLDRDADSIQNCKMSQRNTGKLFGVNVTSFFSHNTTRILPVSESLMAITDGNGVIFMKAQTVEEVLRVSNAFGSRSMDTKHGFASIDFASNILATDVTGDLRTSILGCRCDNNVVGGVTISCSAALFNGIVNEDELSSIDTNIPIQFETNTNRMLLRCEYLRISVEPITFPSQTSDVNQDTGRADRFSSFRECELDPRKCNNVDALIYVMPLCPTPSAGRDVKLKVQCIRNSIYQTCFPYCVGLHQKGAATTPITLYNQKTLIDGVYIANSNCVSTTVDKIDGQEIIMKSSLRSSDFTTLQKYGIAATEQQTSDLNYQCTFSKFTSSVLLPAASAQTCTGGVEFCANQVVPLQESAQQEWNIHTDYPVPTMLASGQPYIFAGNQMLTQKCELDGTKCIFTSTVQTLTSDVHSQYRIMDTLSNIPSLRASFLEKAQAVHGGIVIPHDTMDVFGSRNPAAQTRTGILYGVNPNLLPLRSTLNECSSENKVGTILAIECTTCYKTPRIFYTQPLSRCSQDIRMGVRMETSERVVRACTQNTTVEILMSENDAFWHLRNVCNLKSSNSPINLFIEDITYLNDMNMILTIKRGPIGEFLHVAGMNTTAWPDTAPPMQSSSVHYFINLQTYEVRRDVMWLRKFSTLADSKYSLLCSSDSVVPAYGTYIALTTQLSLKAVLLLTNSYMLNVFGIIEGIISKEKLCNGRKMNHYALDNCKYHPLSTYHLQDMFVRMDRSFDSLTYATVRYFGVLFGFETDLQNWATNSIVVMAGPDSGYKDGIIRAVSRGVFAGMSVLLTVMTTSFYSLSFFVDEIFLKYIIQQLENQFLGSQEKEFVFFAFSNLIFDSIATGTLKSGPLGSQYKICQEYALLTGDAASPLGMAVFHTCAAVFEGIYAIVQVVSSVVTLSALTECICNIDPRVLNTNLDFFEQKCMYKLPATLRPELFMFIQGAGVLNKQCSILIKQFRNVLLEIPLQCIFHMDKALVAASDVPLYLMKVMQIDRTDTTTCTEYDTSLEVVTIVPRPISFFKKCAFLPTCQTKCGREIAMFESEKHGVLRPNRGALRGDLMSFIPAWQAKIPGLNEIFEPLAVQEYPARGDQCDRYIVVLGRPLQSGSRGQFLPWSMYFFCYSDTTFGIVLVSQKMLDTTTTLGIPEDDNIAEKYVVQEIFLVPMDAMTQGAVVVVYLEKLSQSNTILEIVVDSRGEVLTDSIIRSDRIKSDSVCAELSSSVAANCQPTVDASIPYTFLENGDSTSSFSGYFYKIVILPGQQPDREIMDDFVPYTILAMYYTYIQYRVPESTQLFTCEAELEMRLVRKRNRNDESIREHECTMYAAKSDSGKSRPNTVWNLLSTLSDTRTEQILVSQDHNSIFLLQRTGLERIVFDFDTNNRVNFTVTQRNSMNSGNSGIELLWTSKSQTSDYEGRSTTKRIYRSIIMALNTQVDSTIMYTLLETNTMRKTDTENWIMQYVFWLPSKEGAAEFRLENTIPAELAINIVKSNGLAVMVQTTINAECNYMSCQSCNGRKLKNFCTMAQKCAMVNCVGTVVNPNNVFCVMGTMAKEYREIAIYQGNALWFAAVEIAMSIMQIAELQGSRREPINLEGISNIFNTNMCENKDLSAVLAAFFPALIMTIYTSVIGNSQGFSVKDLGSSTYIVRQIFSPGTKLQNTAIVSAVTQTVHQILLGVLMFFYRNTRFIMCALTRFAEFTGGYIKIVNHNIGDTDFCSIDNEYAESAQPQNDESIVRDRITSGAIGDTYTTMNINKQSVIPSKFQFDMALTILLASSMQRIMLIINMNALVDFSLGVIYALARLCSLVESDKCRPASTDFAFVLSCACGDTPFRVQSRVRNSRIKDGAFWCTGIQKHVNMEGDTVFVYNPFSLEELADDLHSAGQDYIDCISRTNEADCLRERQRVYLPQFNSHFTKHSVSPLAVLTRCRENFNAKKWDEGIFGAYEPELIKHIVQDSAFITSGNMKVIQADAELYLREDVNGPVHSCLRNGPTRNRIEACMVLSFSHMNALEQSRSLALPESSTFSESTEVSIFAYFQYTQVEDVNVQRHTDACEFLSSAVFASDPGVRICQLQDDIEGFCGDETGSECKIPMTTLAYEQSIQRNIVELFQVTSGDITLNTVKETVVLEKYSRVKECASSFFASVDRELSATKISNIVNKLDLNLITGEGDLLHQHMDCIFMGAYDHVFFAPTDTNMVLEPMMYSRNASGTSREFELPCEGSMVYDRYAEDVEGSGFFQKTCGTETRIGLMAYAKKNIVSSPNALNVMVAAKIREKIEKIQSNFTNIMNYGCKPGTLWRECCAVAGKCLPGESTFEPAIPEINFEISGSELLMMLMQSINTIQVDVLYNSSVRILFLGQRLAQCNVQGVFLVVFDRRGILEVLVHRIESAIFVYFQSVKDKRQ